MSTEFAVQYSAFSGPKSFFFSFLVPSCSAFISCSLYQSVYGRTLKMCVSYRIITADALHDMNACVLKPGTH